MEEGRKLARVTRTAKDPVRLRRAIVVMMSGRGKRFGTSRRCCSSGAEYVRDRDPRVQTSGDSTRWTQMERPADWGITAFSTWSLAKLREHLMGRGTVAAVDLATGRIYYRIRDRKRHREFLDFLKTLRARWLGEKLYVVVDNCSPHRHPASAPGAPTTTSNWCSCPPTDPG
jgi:hypothetical protein